MKKQTIFSLKKYMMIDCGSETFKGPKEIPHSSRPKPKFLADGKYPVSSFWNIGLIIWISTWSQIWTRYGPYIDFCWKHSFVAGWSRCCGYDISRTNKCNSKFFDLHWKIRILDRGVCSLPCYFVLVSSTNQKHCFWHSPDSSVPYFSLR